MKRASFVSWFAVLMLVGASIPTPVRGQSSVDVSGLAGSSHTDRGRFWNRNQWVLGWRAELVVPVAPTTQVALGALSLDAGFQGDVVTVTAPICFGCTPPPPDVPDFSYLAATVGIRHTLYHGLGVETDVGLGTLSANKHGHAAGSWGAGISLPLVSRFSLLVNARVVRWTMDGNTLYAYPITGGLRLRF